ncbi:phage protein [Streptococcus agalactiae]|uniref:Phage protein n=1 Tax=Streptococcus agalactiae TaxID=1311 RepID=A0A7Z7P5Z8_STRAG|nr:hypothetical protein [Streptococcus agalactiae]SQA20095.1 phage protein [Streptococcus agalactiae]
MLKDPYDEGKLDKNKVLQQPQRLQQLEQLQQLQQLQQLEQLQQLQQLEVTNLSYKAFSDIECAIFYLDPPTKIRIKITKVIRSIANLFTIGLIKCQNVTLF